MSALARYFRHIGCEVHGYDRICTPLTEALENEGMHIHYEPSPEKIPPALDLVVYTPAVPEEFEELAVLRARHYRLYKRAEVLGLISQSRKCIGVAGTHGKTTTSTMVAWLMRKGGVDVTAFLGGISTNFQSNFIAGDSDWVVVEADEFDRSFLHLHPQVAAVLSMDADHLDIYGDDHSVKQGFHAYISNVSQQGLVFYQEGLDLGESSQAKSESYGIDSGQHKAVNLKIEDGIYTFDYQGPDKNISDLRLAMPGRHNVSNATVAIAIALYCGVDPEEVRKGIASFKGIKRRFEYIVHTPDRVYIDDYAHHPTELRAAIGAAKAMYPDEKITGIFQPHLYTRTRDFLDGFAEVLTTLDTCYLMDIYPARELPIAGINSDRIAEKMNGKTEVKRVRPIEVLESLRINRPQVLMTLGAGDIDRLVEPIKRIMLS